MHRLRSGSSKTVGLAGLLGLLVGLAGCSLFSCEDPLERELREKQAALTVRPVVAYRSIKTALRATPMGEAAGKGGPIGDSALGNKLRKWLSPDESVTDGGDSLMDYVALGAELRGLTSKLDALDEDDYPTLLEKILTVQGGQPSDLGFAWGPNHEHLILALLWTGAKGAPPGLALYELEKFKPKDSDPALVHVLGPLFRALTYMRFSWPNLAEREWTAYLAELKTRRDALTQSGLLSATPEQDWPGCTSSVGWAGPRCA